MVAYLTNEKSPLLGRGKPDKKTTSSSSSSGENSGPQTAASSSVLRLRLLIFSFLLSSVVILSVVFARLSAPAPPPPYIRRVAIVGAGPAGASAAYHLQRYAQKSNCAHEITIFEQGSNVGGQATHKVQVYNETAGQTIELGAGHFTSTNKLLLDAVKTMGLQAQMVDDGNHELVGDGSGSFGVYDGHSWLYLEPHISNFLASWWWWAKLFYFYGFSPGRAKGLIASAVTKRNRIYSPSIFPFRSVDDLMEVLKLEEEMSTTAANYFSNHGVSENFQQELINPWIRRRHAQNIGFTNAFGAMLAVEGAKLMTVSGGISKLVNDLVKSSKAELHLETTVLGLRQTAWGGWTIATRRNNAHNPLEDEFGYYDAVILATPWKEGKFDVKSGPLDHTPEEIPYTSLHTVAFTSPYQLSAGYFSGQSPVPDVLLTTLNSEEYSALGGKLGVSGVGSVGFWSLSLLREFIRKNRQTGELQREYLYKIRSAEEIGDVKIREFLGASADGEDAVTWIYRHYEPEAYPYASPKTSFSQISLDDGLWYTSAMDEFCSGSVDMSSLMGANVARLIVDQWVSEGREPPPEKRRPEEHSEQAEGNSKSEEDEK